MSPVRLQSSCVGAICLEAARERRPERLGGGRGALGAASELGAMTSAVVLTAIWGWIVEGSQAVTAESLLRSA